MWCSGQTIVGNVSPGGWKTDLNVSISHFLSAGIFSSVGSNGILSGRFGIADEAGDVSEATSVGAACFFTAVEVGSGNGNVFGTISNFLHTDIDKNIFLIPSMK